MTWLIGLERSVRGLLSVPMVLGRTFFLAILRPSLFAVRSDVAGPFSYLVVGCFGAAVGLRHLFDSHNFYSLLDPGWVIDRSVIVSQMNVEHVIGSWSIDAILITALPMLVISACGLAACARVLPSLGGRRSSIVPGYCYAIGSILLLTSCLSLLWELELGFGVRWLHGGDYPLLEIAFLTLCIGPAVVLSRAAALGARDRRVWRVVAALVFFVAICPAVLIGGTTHIWSQMSHRGSWFLNGVDAHWIDDDLVFTLVVKSREQSPTLVRADSGNIDCGRLPRKLLRFNWSGGDSGFISIDPDKYYWATATAGPFTEDQFEELNIAFICSITLEIFESPDIRRTTLTTLIVKR